MEMFFFYSKGTRCDMLEAMFSLTMPFILNLVHVVVDISGVYDIENFRQVQEATPKVNFSNVCIN